MKNWKIEKMQNTKPALKRKCLKVLDCTNTKLRNCSKKYSISGWISYEKTEKSHKWKNDKHKANTKAQILNKSKHLIRITVKNCTNMKRENGIKNSSLGWASYNIAKVWIRIDFYAYSHKSENEKPLTITKNCSPFRMSILLNRQCAYG